MNFIGKPARFTDDLPVIFYISAFIDHDTDGASNKRSKFKAYFHFYLFIAAVCVMPDAAEQYRDAG
jgi:hypothetical protein